MPHLLHCPKCSFEKLRPYDRFCPRCGARQEHHQSEKPRSPDQFAIDSYKELIGHLQNIRGIAFKRAWIAFAITIVVVALLKTSEMAGLLLFIPFALFVYGFTRPTRLSNHQYNQVINHKSIGHHCIFCGGKGIYRHTIYQTNTTLADCSKCKTNLWVE